VHVNRSLLGWGVFFIVLGAVPLAVRSGALDASVVMRAWELWPLVLIGAGLGLLLARTKAAMVGGLVVAVTAGLMGGSVLAAGIDGFDLGEGFSTCTFRPSEGEPFQDRRGTFAGSARVDIELDCGELEIGTAPGDTWTVSGTSVNGMTPRIEAGDDRLTVRAPRTAGIGIAGGEWTVELPEAVETRLDLSVNAGSARASLAGMALSRVDVSVNAGSATLDLAGVRSAGRVTGDVNAGSLQVSLPAADVTGALSANAGSIQLCVPDGVDLRIRVEDNALGSNNFGDEGLVQRGDTWESPDFGSATATIDMTASANLGSIDLNPEDGCAE
jgi:hypothetical protein